MKIKTRQGNSYAVTSAGGAVITNEKGVVLLSVEAGVQGVFVATGMYVECDDAGAQVTEMTSYGSGSGGGAGGALNKDIKDLCKHVDDSGVHVSDEDRIKWDESSQGFDSHKKDNKCHVSNEDRENWDTTKSELEKLVKKSQVTVDVSTPTGVSNANYNFIHLSGTVVREGVLYKVVHKTRTTAHNRLTTEPRWLGVFEQREGEVYEKVGVSRNTVQQTIGEPSEWLFSGVALSGAPIRLCLLVNTEDEFSESSQFGGVVSDGDGADYVSTDGRITNSVPDITLSMAVDGLREHAGDEVRHVTKEEREKWNGYQATLNNKANSATLTSHTSNASVHLTADERAGLTALLEHKDELLALLNGE